MNHIYQNIEGWFDFSNLYAFIVSSFEKGKFVEIGSWLGKSSAFMAVEIKNSNKNIDFYCVDTWRGSSEHELDERIINDSLFNSFLENTKPVKEYIKPIRKSSEEASKDFEDNSLDFIFIDAGHSYEDVKNDLEKWYPKLKENGIIAGHDFSQAWPGVIMAVNEWANNNNIIFSLTEQSCWIAKKQTQDFNIKILSSHYDEDLSWINFVKYPTTIYSKTLKNKNFIDFNKVQEAPAYLKYIIDNYSNLPEYTIFVHGHLNSEHQKEKNIIEIINNLSLNDDIINLNREDWLGSIQIGQDEWDKKYRWLSDNWDDIFGSYLMIPEKLTFYSCAQFAINKKCILQYPIQFWEKLFNWCKKTELDNYVSSRIFEYTWYYIFSKKALFLDI
jgi:predicted O-methyltransferase YrrM